jgi:hypothetical protein
MGSSSPPNMCNKVCCLTFRKYEKMLLILNSPDVYHERANRKIKYSDTINTILLVRSVQIITLMNRQHSFIRIHICTRYRHSSKWNNSSAIEFILNCIMDICSGMSVILATLCSRMETVIEPFADESLSARSP